MNDAPVDIGVEQLRRTRGTPIDGEALPVLGLVGVRRPQLERAAGRARVGYSLVDIDNTDGQAPDAFHIGHYALANLLFHPIAERDARAASSSGAGARTSATASTSNDFRIQFSVKYSFSQNVRR